MMLAVDTNVLFAAVVAASERHASARSFLDVQANNPNFVIPELALVELYILVRNPAVVSRPLAANDAASIVARFRAHPRWQLVDHDPAIMDDVWARMGNPGVARRRVFDLRMALGLVRHGVTELATRNVADFEGVGFKRVFDPTAPDAA